MAKGIATLSSIVVVGMQTAVATWPDGFETTKTLPAIACRVWP